MPGCKIAVRATHLHCCIWGSIPMDDRLTDTSLEGTLELEAAKAGDLALACEGSHMRMRSGVPVRLRARRPATLPRFRRGCMSPCHANHRLGAHHFLRHLNPTCMSLTHGLTLLGRPSA